MHCNVRARQGGAGGQPPSIPVRVSGAPDSARHPSQWPRRRGRPALVATVDSGREGVGVMNMINTGSGKGRGIRMEPRRWRQEGTVFGRAVAGRRGRDQARDVIKRGT